MNAVISDQQRAILDRLWEAYEDGSADPVWGIEWTSGAESKSEQASIARSLKFLEERGFLIRQNQRTGPYRDHADRPFVNAEGNPHRTTHISFTDMGRSGAWR